MESVCKELQEELQAREQVVADKPPPSTNVGKNECQVPHTATTLVSSATPGTPSCCYCRQGHTSRDCNVATQVEARRQILLKSGRWFACLRRGHMTRECHSKFRCSGCGKKHHMSLCPGDSLGMGKSSGLGQGVESSQREATAGVQSSEPKHPCKLNVNAPPFPLHRFTWQQTRQYSFGLLWPPDATPINPLSARKFELSLTSAANDPASLNRLQEDCR